jgi:hypothetical protein
MALFGSSRDISLFRHISRELVNDIIEQQIGYYKLSLSNSTTNIYGESSEKFYQQPVLLNCLIEREDQQNQDSDFGPDKFRDIKYRFLRDDLVDKNIVPEKGDIILYLNSYYEVDNIIENQLILGKDPDYAYNAPYLNQFGSSFSIVCETHLTRGEKLNIEQQRL